MSENILPETAPAESSVVLLDLHLSTDRHSPDTS